MGIYNLSYPLAKYVFPVLDGIPQQRAVAFQTGTPGYVERYVYPYEDEPAHAYGWREGDKQIEYIKGRVALGIVLVPVRLK